MWRDLINECYRVGKGEPDWLNFETACGEGLIENVILYMPDVIWELYFEALQEDEYTISFADEEWNTYKALLYQDKDYDMGFAEEVNRLKSTRKSVTLLKYIGIDKYKINENEIVFPDYAYIPLHILYLQNREFFGLFTHGKKEGYKGEIVIKYGNLLERYDENAVFGYAYEKLTGVNLALLFANYFEEMFSYLGVRVLNPMTGEPEEDEQWEKNIDEYRKRLKDILVDLMTRLLKLPMVFGRILWAEIILQAFSMEERNFINKKMCGGVIYFINNLDILTYMEKKWKEFISEIEYKTEKERRSCLEKAIQNSYNQENVNGNTFESLEKSEIIDCDQFAKAGRLYEAYKREMKAEKQSHQKENSWRLEEVSWMGRWENIKELIEKVIITGKGANTEKKIGKYLKDEIETKPDEKMPIIFIKEDIIRKRKYQDIVQEFLVTALKKDK